MNDSVRWGLIIAGALIVGIIAIRVIARGGHVVGNAASEVERKL